MGQYLPEYDVWVIQTEELPTSVKGFCTRDGDLDCIVLNAKLSEEERQKAFEHELDHILNGDLDSELSVPEIEAEVQG